LSIAPNGNLSQSYSLQGVTCHMRSDSVTCDPTQVNAPRLSHLAKSVRDLPSPERWKAESTLVLVIYRDG